MTKYYDDWKTRSYSCDRCSWAGAGSGLRAVDLYEELVEYGCPSCGTKLLNVMLPTIEESRANWDKLDEHERRHIENIERIRDRFDRESLKATGDLPDIDGDRFTLTWDLIEATPGDLRTVIMLNDQILFSEPAVFEGYERFAEVAEILKAKYGARLVDLVPTEQSQLYLYGDSISASEFVERTRAKLSSRVSY